MNIDIKKKQRKKLLNCCIRMITVIPLNLPTAKLKSLTLFLEDYIRGFTLKHLVNTEKQKPWEWEF